MPQELKRKSLPVPANFNPNYAGLKRIEHSDPSFIKAMRMLEQSGEFPWNTGFTRQAKLGIPKHDPNAMAWREPDSDIINVNQTNPFYLQAQKDDKFTPILSGMLLHENRHVMGDDEPKAYNAQADWLGLLPKKYEAAHKFGEIIRNYSNNGMSQ